MMSTRSAKLNPRILNMGGAKDVRSLANIKGTVRKRQERERDVQMKRAPFCFEVLGVVALSYLYGEVLHSHRESKKRENNAGSSAVGVFAPWPLRRALFVFRSGPFCFFRKTVTMYTYMYCVPICQG